MMRRLPKLFILLGVMACFGTADQIAVGDLSYDQISANQTEFDITNLTGLNSFPPDFPITSALTFTITSLVVDFTSGPALVLTGSDFTVEDAQDDIDCDVTVTGVCNLFGDNITSATLT